MKTRTSSFSWARVAQLYQYNAPWIRKQTTIYFLFSLVASLLYLFLPSQTVRMAVFSPCSTVLLFMFIWAPIVFTKGGDTRIIDRLIPAAPSEKFVFYMSYLLVVIGMACFLCPWIAEGLYQALYPGEENGIDSLRNALELPVYYKCSNYLSPIAAMLTCFYCVVGVKRDRIMKAYLISPCVLVLMSSLYTFYGIKESIALAYKNTIDQAVQINEVEMADKVYSAITDHFVFLTFCMALSIVYVILMTWLSYRSLYRRNL